MPYLLTDLVINRVDLVDEGANSAAFIELYKRKEQLSMTFEEILSKMKPEHAEVIKSELSKSADTLKATQDDLVKAKKECEDAKKECEDAKKECEDAKKERDQAKEELEAKSKAGSEFDETETLKSMPKAAMELFEKMKAQKEAAEEEVRKAKDAEKTAEAIAKAKELKAIPVEQEKLVNIIKGADSNLLDLLGILNSAIEGTVLGEVGKSATGTAGKDEADAAWSKIEAKADEIVKRDTVSKAKAISVVIKENPELYKEYLKGGAK